MFRWCAISCRRCIETFDFPEPSETKGVREVTTVPTQALFLMNSRFVIDQASTPPLSCLRPTSPRRKSESLAFIAKSSAARPLPRRSIAPSSSSRTRRKKPLPNPRPPRSLTPTIAAAAVAARRLHSSPVEVEAVAAAAQSKPHSHRSPPKFRPGSISTRRCSPARNSAIAAKRRHHESP